MSKKLGFTFIELLVVVTIILILSVVASLSFVGANQKSRDSRRKIDMEKIRTALELYRQENGRYPTTPNSNFVSGQVDTGIIGRYLDSWPNDPKASFGNYEYILDSNFTYRLQTCLELGPANSIVGPKTCTGSFSYVLTNP